MPLKTITISPLHVTMTLTCSQSGYWPPVLSGTTMWGGSEVHRAATQPRTAQVSLTGYPAKQWKS